jgi:hypothetical protein
MPILGTAKVEGTIINRWKDEYEFTDSEGQPRDYQEYYITYRFGDGHEAKQKVSFEEWC